MSEDALAHLAVELLTAIHALSGYAVPASLPAMQSLPHSELEARVCPRNGCGVKAFYIQGEGIYLDDALDPAADMGARSILLHELVHYVQGVSGKFAAMAPCRGWYAKEQEAYSIQNAYLRSQGSKVTFFMDSGWRNCADDR